MMLGHFEFGIFDRSILTWKKCSRQIREVPQNKRFFQAINITHGIDTTEETVPHRCVLHTKGSNRLQSCTDLTDCIMHRLQSKLYSVHDDNDAHDVNDVCA